MHTRLLIGSQRTLKILTGVDPHEPIGLAQGRQRLRQPGAGNGLAPIDVGWCGSFISGNASPSQHSHRLTERNTIGSGAALDGLKLLECAIQSFMIDLDPLATD